ncbi:hypothetical protein WJ971_14960 [Achromobacter xylosoxidans]
MSDAVLLACGSQSARGMCRDRREFQSYGVVKVGNPARIRGQLRAARERAVRLRYRRCNARTGFAGLDGRGDLTVGESAAGTLTISNGGSVRNDWAFIGYVNGGDGTLTVTGVDGSGKASSWTSLSPVYIGADPGSTGTLRILDGGVAQSYSGTLGSSAGSVGTAIVSGPKSTWNLNAANAFIIGADGKGTLHIDNGGAVRSGQGMIGWNTGGEGNVTVSGRASAWNPFNNIYVGFDGTGELLVQDGATVHTEASTSPGAPASIYIGQNAGGIGTVTVSSTTGDISTLSATDRINVGWAGTGALTVAKGGLAIAARDTWVAIDGTSTGTLNLTGDASGRGVLETGSVIKGAGNVTVNLDGGILRANRDEGDFLRASPRRRWLPAAPGSTRTAARSAWAPRSRARPSSTSWEPAG